MIRIEYIDNNHKFFSDVKQLGRKNAATLGFMPEGGFDDHACAQLRVLLISTYLSDTHLQKGEASQLILSIGTLLLLVA